MIIQLFDLSDGERKWLANHLGHELNIHESVYKRQEYLIEVTKVGKMLTALDSGQAGTYTGRSLADIGEESSIRPSTSGLTQDEDLTYAKKGRMVIRDDSDTETADCVTPHVKNSKTSVVHERIPQNDQSAEGSDDEMMDFERCDSVMESRKSMKLKRRNLDEDDDLSNRLPTKRRAGRMKYTFG